MENYQVPNWLILLAAAGQVIVGLIYPYVRHAVFDWYNDIKKLKPLNQEIAKTYGRYIQGLNLSFGLIAFLFTDQLQDHSGLAVAITGLIAAYWTGKIITQFAYYPMYQIPNRIIFKIGEIGLNALFICFSVTFIWLFVNNLIGYIKA